jgi:hypothetical protein
MSAQHEPLRWGRYAGPAEFYESPKWLAIVRASLKHNRQHKRDAISRNDSQALKFYEAQIELCRRELHGEERSANARSRSRTKTK